MVEDNEDIREAYEILFNFNKYDVFEMAKNGVEAVEMYKSFLMKPDLIIMDHKMPYKNGIEAMKEIFEINNNAKVIFASADDTVKEYAISIGAMSFKKKPFLNNKLISNIQKALAL